MTWRVYDGIADTYERIHAPRFAVIAADLAAYVDVGGQDRVLDLGSGTGVAAEAARERGARSVVGADIAHPMLQVAARERGGILLVGAEAVDLPFPNGSFEVVLANFVLPNLKNHTTALAEILRVLRPEGRFAMTAWSDQRDELETLWDEVAATFMPPRMLQQMRDTEYPDFSNFGGRSFTEEVLNRAGMRGIRSEERSYRFAYGLDEYLEGREVFKSGRFVREMLGERGWDAFREQLRGVFAERYADPLQDSVAVVFARGTKPI